MFQRFKDLFRKVVGSMFSKGTVQRALDVEISVSDKMSNAINLWRRIYENQALWLNDNVKSLNLGAVIASELARLTTIEMESSIQGNDYLDKQYQEVLKHIRTQTEYACSQGGLVFKPYIDGDKIVVDYVQASNFYPTAFNNRGEITGAVFIEEKQLNNKVYSRIEHHSLDKTGYTIKNSAYVKENGAERNDYSLGKQIPLASVDEWQSLAESLTLKNIDKPLFAYFKMPQANTVDFTSPLGVSVFSKATDLIKEADKQYSRILWEYEGSELAIDVDITLFKKDSNGQDILPEGKERLYRKLDLDDNNNKWNVFSPTIRDSNLFNGLNNLLKRIEFNCGLSYGTISDPQEIEKTATEIISSKQRLYSTVSDIQKALQSSLEHLAYAMYVWAVLAKLSKPGKYETSFKWDDSIIVDKEAELASMQVDASNGLIRTEIYLAKKYGVTEEEAKKMMPKVDNTLTKSPFDEE